MAAGNSTRFGAYLSLQSGVPYYFKVHKALMNWSTVPGLSFGQLSPRTAMSGISYRPHRVCNRFPLFLYLCTFARILEYSAVIQVPVLNTVYQRHGTDASFLQIQHRRQRLSAAISLSSCVHEAFNAFFHGQGSPLLNDLVPHY